MSFLRLHDVAFAFPGQPPVLQGIDLDVSRGSVHCLVGRSGCGKTTLLKLAAGLLAPSRGQIAWDGASQLAAHAVGFVFQSPTLLDWLDARANVLLPVTLRRKPTPDDVQAADALLTQLGLGALAHRHPRQLSGGQQSRVALARALLQQPPLLLLDEPFAALDALTREELQRDLLALVRARGTTVLFVTHDIHEAVFLGDHVSVLDAGRLVRTLAIEPAARVRDSAAFAAACAQVRAGLVGAEVEV